MVNSSNCQAAEVRIYVPCDSSALALGADTVAAAIPIARDREVRHRRVGERVDRRLRGRRVGDDDDARCTRATSSSAAL